MKLDLFCTPFIICDDDGVINIDYNHIFDCIFRPNTGYKMIDKYYIAI